MTIRNPSTRQLKWCSPKENVGPLKVLLLVLGAQSRTFIMLKEAFLCPIRLYIRFNRFPEEHFHDVWMYQEVCLFRVNHTV
ncbi:hypothetical protein NDU88_007044 [Pleurodeles waltl]|uniref:Uncharacterized protein n=1 Tax=Pleurodeles waltl TaxID=8319 RepID=A0AAV7QJP3_PLEWA|nr:hypothetical protein NDU88_007044 [Pleurodeles waltl]